MTISNNPKPPAGALSGEGEVIIIAGDYYEYGTAANEVIISDACFEITSEEV